MTTSSTEPAATEPGFAGPVISGVSVLDDHVLLGDAGLGMAMARMGADVLIDLRGEVKPPGLPIQIDHFPIMDLEPGQEEIIAAAAQHVAELVKSGKKVGLYCQAGVSRTSTVAIAYLMTGGMRLPDALALVRRVRPQSMPAVELMKSLERIEDQLMPPGE